MQLGQLRYHIVWPIKKNCYDNAPAKDHELFRRDGEAIYRGPSQNHHHVCFNIYINIGCKSDCMSQLCTIYSSEVAAFHWEIHVPTHGLITLSSIITREKHAHNTLCRPILQYWLNIVNGKCNRLVSRAYIMFYNSCESENPCENGAFSVNRLLCQLGFNNIFG